MKRLFTFACFVMLFMQSRAQTTPVDFQNVIPISTISPDAASLGKFGNIPVSYYTGVPSVTIPLYEINAGSIKIPISLDYHSGGVRVDEIASSVGLSWALNGIGMVSRNVVGLPDEASGGYLRSPSLDSLYNFFLGTAYGIIKDIALANFMYDVRNQRGDTEPDVFSYTLNGESGKFIYRHDGSIMQIPVTNNRIEIVPAGGDNNFKITDQNGTVYIFDQKEWTEMVSGGATGPGTYVSSWRLSKMIASNGVDTVSFKYDASGSDLERTWNFSYLLGSSSGSVASPGGSGYNSSVSSIVHSSEMFPTEIDWRGGKVLFKNVRDRTDRSSEMRLDSVNVYAKQNGSYSLIKSIKLYQSYFFSNPIPGATADNRNYRLRLDSVAFLPVRGNMQPQNYTMTYYDYPMAPAESFAQDIWGYNNGAFRNISMMPQQSALWLGTYYNFGDANMEPDTTGSYYLACMLQSIKYPTKGTSVFTFEPHKYLLNYQTTREYTTRAYAFGGTAGYKSADTVYFTPASNQSNFAYVASLSAYSFPGNQPVISQRPDVSIYDQTTGQRLVFFNNVSNPESSLTSLKTALNVIQGHTYMAIASIYTTDPRISASCDIYWTQPDTGVSTKMGGGLRVSTITNYDNNGNFINKEQYQYGNNGVGTLLTNANYLLVNYETMFYSKGLFTEEGHPCAQYLSPHDRLYHSKSVYPATQFSGTPVVYPGVTKLDVDGNGVSNGKSVYEYTIYNDVPGDAIQSLETQGIWLISTPWKNGFMTQESIYKSNGSSFSPVSIKHFDYSIYRGDTLLGLKIKPLWIQIPGDCEIIPDTTICRIGSYDSQNLFYTHFFEDRLPTYTGAMLLQSESDTTFDSSGNKVVAVHNNYYDDLTHIFPTRKETFNSKGDDLVDVIRYPHDLAAAGNVYQTMLNRNIVSPPVRFIQRKNNMQLDSTNINYNDWYGNGALLLEKSVDANILSNPMDRRVNFDKYDQYGNILQQEKAKAPYQSYQWGYYGQYPVAKIVNAPVNDIFYDSFEEGNGNSALNDAKTGHYSFLGSYSKTLTGLDTGKYILSYWSKTGGVWAWNFVNNIHVTGSSYPITLSGSIDDVRFYPAMAQMSTYTYDPLIGMTSATDVKGEITYYEYDGLQRLVTIRDKDKNILKHFDYHYQTSNFIPK